MRSTPPRLRPAPRPVPLSLWLRVLNGAAFAQIGWILLGFTMLFVWVFGGNALVRDLYFFSGPLDYTEGEITRVEETNLSIDDERVYAYHYRYSAAGERFDGQTDGFYGAYAIGATAPVEYALRDPGRSRLEGLDISTGGLYFVWIFPTVALGFLLTGLRKGLRGARLLGNGELVEGRLTTRKPTNTSVNDQTVWEFTFEFQTERGHHGWVTARTHETRRFGGERAGDVTELLLHDRDDPRRAMLIDDLPGHPEIGEDGLFRGDPSRAAATLLLPAVTLGTHGAWLLHVLEVW